MNHSIITGHVVRDPELFSTADGTAGFRVRVRVPGMGRGRDDRGRPRAGFIDVTEFGSGAEQRAQKFRKGAFVGAAGRTEHHTWPAADGQTRESYQLIGRLELLSPARGNRGGRDRSSERAVELADGREYPMCDAIGEYGIRRREAPER